MAATNKSLALSNKSRKGAKRLTGATINERVSPQHRVAALNPEERTTAVKGFLTEVARRCFLDNVQRRLRTEGSPVVIEREAGIPTWVAYLLADQASASDNREVLKLVDLRELPVPSESSLQSIFGLSVAEARLAQGLARGEALEKVARCLGIKMSTARTHLKVIFAKTGTRRQAALTAALSRLAHLLGD